MTPKELAAALRAKAQGRKQAPRELAAQVQQKRQQVPQVRRQAGVGQAPWSTATELDRLALVRAQFFVDAQKIRGLDLFAGAGGFTIGAMRADCPVIGVEYESRPVQTGRRAGHDVLRMDVREAAKHPTTGLAMDVFIGGPPCQPFSQAGKRQGCYDPREGFQLTFPVLDAWRPRRAVFENVSDFLLDEHASFRREVMDGLKQRFVHTGIWELNAKDFGVPQDRARVFLWGSDVPLSPPVPTHGPGTSQPYVTPRQVLPHLLEQGFAALHAFQGGAVSRSTDKPAMTISTRRNFYAVARQGFVYRVGAGGLRDERDRAVPESQRRILSPDEIAVLQAFPASFGFVGNLAEQAKQIGNAVPPPLAAAVVAAVTAGLKPRKTTPTELLDSFSTLDEEILVREPRPWSDAALIGVTTASSRAPGALVPVYDGYRLREAVFEAEEAWLAEQSGVSVQRLRTDHEAMEEASVRALDFLSSTSESAWESGAPIIVPTGTLAALGLPSAVMLLSYEQQIAAVIGSLKDQKRRRELTGWEGRWPPPEEDWEDVVNDVVLDLTAEHGEIWGGWT